MLCVDERKNRLEVRNWSFTKVISFLLVSTSSIILKSGKLSVLLQLEFLVRVSVARVGSG